MEEILGQSLLEKNLQIKPEILIGTLLLSFVLGLFISWIYKKTHNGISYSRSLPFTMMVIPIIVSIILMAIGSSIALSLGLVGSLSILRFRTAIRDTRDMVYIFVSVAAGLSCGSGNYTLAIVGILFFLIVSLIVERLSWFSKVNDDYLLTIHDSDGLLDISDKLNNVFIGLCKQHQIKSIVDSVDGSELTVTLVMKKDSSTNTMLTQIKELTSPNAIIRLVAPDNTVLF